VTEDRLLGGLDLEKTLAGEPALKPGLVAQAHGGVLYIDEVNLLPDHLADALLDAVASGVHIVERDGLAKSLPAAFVLVGSMNPEEGALRPQLLDRFALTADVEVPIDPANRRLIVERRLAFDRDPDAFLATWSAEQLKLTEKLNRAREAVEALTPSPDILDFISRIVCEEGARSLRADLAVVRASRALAALDNAAAVTEDHVRTVLPLVLAHRASRRRAQSQSSGRVAPPVEPPRDDPSTARQRDAGQAMPDRVFAPRDVPAPRIVVQDGSSEAMGVGRADAGPERGAVVHARTAAAPRELALHASVVHAVTSTGSVALRREDLHEAVRAPESASRYIFVVDSSGSHAIERRMQAVKGAVLGVLDRSVSRFDEVVLVVFRGATATVLCQPTRDREAVQRALEYVPTGGRTPLADALDVAGGYVTDHSVLVLVTDGRANVPRWTDDAWRDALRAAGAIACPTLVVDSEIGSSPSGRARQLADAIGAPHIVLDDLSSADIVQVARR
jgi:magnesium chelatase subunit D